MTSDARRQSARDLLEDVARQGNDLETVARGVLARLAELTGLSSTYLAETRLMVDEQYIVFSCNRSDVFHIPEDVTLPWSEGVCRFVVEGGPNYTTDAQKQFPSSSVPGFSRFAPLFRTRCSPLRAASSAPCAARARSRSKSSRRSWS